MLTVPLFLEFLRARPVWLFWFAALAQCALWALVPSLFYSAPPGQLAETLAIGHEFQLGTSSGPPLAYWLAEIAFRAGGSVGVYFLSQVCVLVTYWAVFTLGRRTVGDKHAAMAVLLMVGISALTVPTPDFGPGILAMPLWALALLHYWRAVGEGQGRYWLVLGLDIGLLMLTTYAAVVLGSLLILFTLLTARGRAQFLKIEPYLAGVVVVIVFFPHLIWVDQHGGLVFSDPDNMDDNVLVWARLIAMLIVGHAGLGILVALARGFSLSRRKSGFGIERPPIDPFARRFVYFFALVPALAIVLLALFTSRTEAFVSGPLVVLSGLAVIVCAGDRIHLVHQRMVSLAWAGLLLLPPLIVAVAVTLLPWTLGVNMRLAQPAAKIGAFFADSFERRTGRPLAVVSGDPRIASLVAMYAPSRPSLLLYATPEKTPWVTRQSIEEMGAVVVWPTTDTSGAPPAAIREAFPGLQPEVPSTFERHVQGRLPPLRIGWALIRPRPQAPPAR
jgi:4-amino-4-deoxy-L-arabinose transferase-like glycosyltransferase